MRVPNILPTINAPSFTPCCLSSYHLSHAPNIRHYAHRRCHARHYVYHYASIFAPLFSSRFCIVDITPPPSTRNTRDACHMVEYSRHVCSFRASPHLITTPPLHACRLRSSPLLCHVDKHCHHQYHCSSPYHLPLIGNMRHFTRHIAAPTMLSTYIACRHSRYTINCRQYAISAIVFTLRRYSLMPTIIITSSRLVVHAHASRPRPRQHAWSLSYHHLPLFRLILRAYHFLILPLMPCLIHCLSLNTRHHECQHCHATRLKHHVICHQPSIPLLSAISFFHYLHLTNIIAADARWSRRIAPR